MGLDFGNHVFMMALSGNHAPGGATHSGNVNTSFRILPQVFLMATSADSDCIHLLLLTASLIPRLLIGSQLTPVNSRTADDCWSKQGRQKDS